MEDNLNFLRALLNEREQQRDAACATAARLAGLLKEYCSNAPPGIQERIDAALADYDTEKTS